TQAQQQQAQHARLPARGARDAAAAGAAVLAPVDARAPASIAVARLAATGPARHVVTAGHRPAALVDAPLLTRAAAPPRLVDQLDGDRLGGVVGVGVDHLELERVGSS